MHIYLSNQNTCCPLFHLAVRICASMWLLYFYNADMQVHACLRSIWFKMKFSHTVSCFFCTPLAKQFLIPHCATPFRKSLKHSCWKSESRASSHRNWMLVVTHYCHLLRRTAPSVNSYHLPPLCIRQPLLALCCQLLHDARLCFKITKASSGA